PAPATVNVRPNKSFFILIYLEVAQNATGASGALSYTLSMLMDIDPFAPVPEKLKEALGAIAQYL
uniref:hypothetical protein n=1 Tax=Candidatus Fimivicinus sp. TaxID=3056640 RepID=UPI003FEFF427